MDHFFYCLWFLGWEDWALTVLFPDENIFKSWFASKVANVDSGLKSSCVCGLVTIYVNMKNQMKWTKINKIVLKTPDI